MHLQVLFVVFAQCLTLSSLINGAPAGGSDKGEPSDSRNKQGEAQIDKETQHRFTCKLCGQGVIAYSQQEDAFLKDQVLAQQELRDMVSWETIAAAHESKVKNKDLGFNTKRTVDGLRNHFENLKAEVSAWKERSTLHAQKFTKQEEDFINRELSKSNQLAEFYSDSIWENILALHNLKREQKCEGFSIERSLSDLRSHFQPSKKPGQRVSKEVKARCPKNSKTSTEGTSSNKKPRFDLNSMPSEDDVYED